MFQTDRGGGADAYVSVEAAVSNESGVEVVAHLDVAPVVGAIAPGAEGGDFAGGEGTPVVGGGSRWVRAGWSRPRRGGGKGVTDRFEWGDTDLGHVW